MSEPYETESFRAEAHRMVDWIADYLEGGARRFPVLSKNSPGDLSRNLPQEMPAEPQRLEDIWKDFETSVLPGVTHWNHPGFMAYFGITGSGPGILGELLSAALNVNGMLWRTCPSATELELVVLGWLREALGLPPELFGFLTDTASISSMLAIAAAREAADELAERWGVGVDLWSATSYKRLREEALGVERHNRLHPTEPAEVPLVTRLLAEGEGPVVAVTDFQKLLPGQVARWIPRPFHTLGTDGFGRSDTREALRRFFEVDTGHVVVAVLHALSQDGTIDASLVAEAIAHHGLDVDIADPGRHDTVPVPGSSVGREHSPD
jgi:hypothetical protein